MEISEVIKNEKTNLRRVSVNARRTLTYCIFACALLLFSQVMLSGFYIRTDSEISYILWGIMIYTLSFLIPFGVLKIFFTNIQIITNETAPKRYFPRNPLLFITGTLGIGYIFTFTVNLLFEDFVKKVSFSESFVPESDFVIVLFYIYKAVLPAIIEEWAFRGLILKYLLPYGKNGAIIISALLFGLVHIQPIQVIFTFIMGVLLAICYEYTNSLLVPIIVHFLNNAFSVSFLIFKDNMIFKSIAPVLIIALMICAVAAIISFSKRWINKKKVSLIKPQSIGRKLSAVEYLINFFINIGMLPFVSIITYLVYLYYFV